VVRDPPVARDKPTDPQPRGQSQNKTLPPTSPHSFLKKNHTYSSRHTDHLWFATNLPIPNLGVKVKINGALPPTSPIPF